MRPGCTKKPLKRAKKYRFFNNQARALKTILYVARNARIFSAYLFIWANNGLRRWRWRSPRRARAKSRRIADDGRPLSLPDSGHCRGRADHAPVGSAAARCFRETVAIAVFARFWCRNRSLVVSKHLKPPIKCFFLYKFIELPIRVS